MKWTEAEIQALKAQEAKDLAVEFFQMLEAKEKGPISPGEVQLKELDFNLRFREAEIEDRRRRELHEKRIKELELQIQQEKTRAAEAEEMANQVRQSHARVIERVAEATESLSTQLERATRTHNLKLEQLASSFAAKEEQLSRQLRELEQSRDALREEISTLTDLRGEALEIGHLREEIERRKKETKANTATWRSRLPPPSLKRPSASVMPSENSSSSWPDSKLSTKRMCYCGTGRRPKEFWPPSTWSPWKRTDGTN